MYKDKWGYYYHLVYGHMPDHESFPLTPEFIWVLYDDLLAKAGVTRIPTSVGRCPRKNAPKGQRYKDWPLHKFNPQVSGVWHPYPYAAIRGHKWVEVMHTKDPADDEHHGAWLFYAPGSGTYFWMGKTISFPDHAQAFAYFHVPPIGVLAQNEKMSLAAAAQGYDSVQFLAHPDIGEYPCQPQSGLSYMGIEIVAVKLVGTCSCLTESPEKPPYTPYLRSGWKAKYSCHCTNSLGWLNCHGKKSALNDSVVIV